MRLLYIFSILFLCACNAVDSNYTNKVDFKRTFMGKCEGSNLALSITHIDSKLTGEFSYHMQKFNLNGELNNRGKFQLKVLDSLGNETGIIKGKLKSGNQLKGNWTELAGNIQHDLSLNMIESSTPIDFNEVYKMTQDWNNSINSKDFIQIANSYDDTITFYTEWRPKDFCIKLKMKYIEKYPDYTQFLDKDVLVNEYKSGLIKAEFNKTMTRNGEVRKYPSYLIFKKVNNELKIVEEGDMLTNTNLNKTLDLGEIERTQTLDQYTHKEIPVESSTPLYTGLLLLIGSISGGGYYYKKRKKKKTVVPQKERVFFVEKEVVIEKEVVVEKEIIVEKKVVVERETFIEVSSDRNLSESEIKGKEFEDFVVVLVNENYYELTDWTSDKKVKGRYPKSSENPDLVFALKTKNERGEYFFDENNYKSFAIECKFRNELYNDRVLLCLENQLERYQNFGRKNGMDVFIVLGLGGFASDPSDLFIIPVEQISRGYLFRNELQKFYRDKLKSQKLYYDKNKQQLM